MGGPVGSASGRLNRKYNAFRVSSPKGWTCSKNLVELDRPLGESGLNRNIETEMPTFRDPCQRAREGGRRRQRRGMTARVESNRSFAGSLVTSISPRRFRFSAPLGTEGSLSAPRLASGELLCLA